MSLLSLSRLVKNFGGLNAVNNVSFSIEEGTISGLIGPNGAGKTTVFNLITGIYSPDQGEILFRDRSITRLRAYSIVSLGIARTFQTIRLFQNMSVIENVLAGCHLHLKSGVISSLFHPPRQRIEERHALMEALRILDFVGLKGQEELLAKNLSYGNQRLLEIARALATRPKLLILDEPAGGMNDLETAQLVTLIRRIREGGVTVLLIEHDMTLVMEVCERIVVLEYGSKIAEGPPDAMRQDARVIEAYLGSEKEW
ncbi:MAG: ABC transporter ATP-binding protein [Syntrophobacteraceae bacterium]